MGYQPPDQPEYQPPYQPRSSRRRRGCGGCLIGCVVAVVLVVVVMIAGFAILQRMFPSQESLEGAAGCAIPRVVIVAGEQWVELGQGTPQEQAEIRRTLAEAQQAYAEACPESSVLR